MSISSVEKRRALVTLFLVNLALIFFVWWQGSSSLLLQQNPGSVLIALGRITGLLAEYLLLLQLILIGRIRVIETAFAFDRMNQLHRWIGTYLVLLLVLHPILLVLGYAQANQLGLAAQFVQFLTGWEGVFLGFIGLIFFVILTVLSLPIIRQKLRYETWHATHLGMYLAIALIFDHQVQSGDVTRGSAFAYWFALNFLVFGLVLVYRVLRPLWLYRRHRFVIERVVQETPEVTSVYITGRDMRSFHFNAGQFAEMLFWQKGLRSWHPFSFSAPYNGTSLRFSMKQLGDFTNHSPELQPGTPVLIDGPLGLFIGGEATHKKFLLIAGGIGVTPIRSLMEELLAQEKNVICLYACRDRSHVVFHDELQQLVDAAQERALYHVFLSATDTATIREPFHLGRVTREALTTSVPDIAERDVYICGPWVMVEGVINDCLALGVKKSAIHFEKFQF